MNLVEVWFGIVERQAIRRGVFKSVKDLNAKIRTLIDGWNDRSRPFVWTKGKADGALEAPGHGVGRVALLPLARITLVALRQLGAVASADSTHVTKLLVHIHLAVFFTIMV